MLRIGEKGGGTTEAKRLQIEEPNWQVLLQKKKIASFIDETSSPPPNFLEYKRKRAQKTLPKKSGVGGGERKREQKPSIHPSIQEIAGEERAGAGVLPVTTTSDHSAGLAFGAPGSRPTATTQISSLP